MPNPIPLSEFLTVPGPILDVRSPGEFQQAHIPGAIAFPLFSDDERAAVGTCYKRKGREQAIELGFEIIGPKCATLVRQAKRLATAGQVRVHCWRGGLRSETIAWALRIAGLEVAVLGGGYKAFRRWCLQQLELPRPVVLLGGMTGSGKTPILHELAERGEQIVDLEGLANHRGSSYGALGLPDQPSTEQFENKLALEWLAIDPQRRVWLEAESRNVGCCRIPDSIFQQMETAPVLRVRRSRQERIQTIADIYGSSDLEGLVAATERLRKRLGNERTNKAKNYIAYGEMEKAIELVLPYYDKTYSYDLERRQTPSVDVDIEGKTPGESSVLLIEQVALLEAVERSGD